jgi:hypothetical protein
MNMVQGRNRCKEIEAKYREKHGITDKPVPGVTMEEGKMYITISVGEAFAHQHQGARK